MAMVISTKAKGMICAFICLMLLSAGLLVTASTKGWLFGLNKQNGEHVAARIQVTQKTTTTTYLMFANVFSTNKHKMITEFSIFWSIKQTIISWLSLQSL